MKRRQFITVLGTTAIAAPILGTAASCAMESEKFEGHKFPELKYDFNALEPYIDAQTMELHYTKHHQGYFNKFLAAAEGTEFLNLPMTEVLSKISRQSGAMRNNGGGFYNHTLFWENMNPSPGDIPEDLQKAIENDFGSLEDFKARFSAAAKTHFGSGWAWLSMGKDGKLFVSSTSNQDNPLMDVVDQQGVPLLGLDVWEHAYYLNYQNRRADYVDNFWNVVDWEVVSKRLETVKV